MGNANTLRPDHLIDTASMLFGRKPLPPSRAEQQNQLAMKRRLAELNAATDKADKPDDITQDPEFILPREAAPKPTDRKRALVIIALLAATGWAILGR